MIQQAHQEKNPGILFSPGIRILNRLKYPSKFGLLGLLAGVSIGFYVLLLNFSMRGETNSARNERAAMGVYLPTAKFAQQIQLHTMLAFGTAVDPAFKPALQTRSAEVDASIKAVDAALASNNDPFDLSEAWKVITLEWQHVRSSESALKPGEVQALYQKLNRLTLDFIGDIGEASGLLSDNSRDANHLADILIRKLPNASDRLALLGDNSVHILATRELGSEWNRYAALTEETKSTRDDLLESFSKAAAVNPHSQDKLKAAAEAIKAEYPPLLETMDREIAKGGLSMPASEMLEAITKTSETIYSQITPVSNALNELLDQRIVRLDARFWSYSGFGAVMVFFLFYFALGMFVAILKSVSDLDLGAWHLGEGNLAYRIRYTARDELKAVADQFDSMAERFAQVINQVQQTSTELVSSSAALNASASHIIHSSERQSEAASSMAAAVQQMTAGIEGISLNAAAADVASCESGLLSTSGGEVVKRTVVEMSHIAEVVNQSAEVIGELGKNSTVISSIVKSIKDIANQTNLLALNASIEAARAGEEGRGFAVVADEVRKLADRTAGATQEIGVMVAAIQDGTTRAVIAMKDGVERVRGGMELTNQSGHAMQRISEESDRVVRSVSEISAALREQAVASSEIAAGVEDIARMAEANHSVVSQTASTSDRLAGLAQQLGQDVRRFKI